MNLPETDVLIAKGRDSQILYYRNLVLVAFDDTVPGAAIGAFLDRYHAVIIGGADFVGPRGGYVLQIPDPGTSLEALDTILTRMEKDQGVAETTWLTYQSYAEPPGGGRAELVHPSRTPQLDSATSMKPDN